MIFNKHLDLIGEHAFLSPSKYHWINYEEEKLISTFTNHLATERGNRLHAYACESILLGIKLPKSKKALNCFINDAIGFRMIPEQILYYSENAFGTTDAICFRDNFLRIHDLKTGVSPVTLHQLEVYTALFCLEYNFRPSSIDIELRIYQTDEIVINKPETETILNIMNKIVSFDKIIKRIKKEETINE